MGVSETRTRLDEMNAILAAAEVADWPDISGYLHPEVDPANVNALEAAKRGMAFVTYDYGIDGVSIEISKYADCCEAFLSDLNILHSHRIGHRAQAGTRSANDAACGPGRRGQYLAVSDTR